MGLCVFIVLAGLEDSTMGSVADTVARVLRGCLENMPEGERARPQRLFLKLLCTKLLSSVSSKHFIWPESDTKNL